MKKRSAEARLHRPARSGSAVRPATAEKRGYNGRYSKNKLLNSFTAVILADKPRYLLLYHVGRAEGARRKPTLGATTGWNAVPTGGKVTAFLDCRCCFGVLETAKPSIWRLAAV